VLNIGRVNPPSSDLIPGLVKAEASVPSFEPNGFLPPGVHDCSLDSLAQLVVFNDFRRGHWLQLMGFLAWPILNRRFSYAYIGGGYISTKPETRDVDVVLQTRSPYGPDAFTAVSRFFAAGLDQIEEIYGVHLQFWMKDAPAGLKDYRAFFQYDRPDLLRHVLNPARGIVRLDLTAPGWIENLRRHLRGDALPNYPR
jgi:hypothetical protein